jgi:hypothetical protein
MRYMKKFKAEENWFEVGHDVALKTVLGSYKDNLEVRGMLSVPNFIPCMFSYIRVFDDDGNTAKDGDMCLIPEEILQAEAL